MYSFGTKITKKGDMVTVQRGLYKRLTAHKDQLKSATVERRVLGGWCLVIYYGGKAHRFKHVSKGGAERSLQKLLQLTK
ncbi:hypothetical protein BpsS36_00052 [Bacillus phage vB_BpsS-36]|uniref:Uncharacterized protein n=1 Tax=Bacillus phage vB_BpsS-36 TaxID=2419622 RepID=A0A3G3BX17_9CAUD|nr:hypothetical protein BpsS36_00052 [Bacillus phage vB_BpsS-36]